MIYNEVNILDNKSIKKEINTLIKKGEELSSCLLRDKDTNEYSKLDVFIGQYEIWYTKALAIIKLLAPDRMQDFTLLYSNPKRKELDSNTYCISDALRNTTHMFGEYGPSDATMCVVRQLGILRACVDNLDSTIHNIQTILQADIFDSEIETAKHLLKKGFLRASGVICGVIIEKHLASVCSAHNIKIVKKNPTIADFNDTLMQIQQSEFHNPQLEKLMKKLHEQLQTVSGKKVYGYLPQDVKQTVNDILAELANDKQVSQLYEKWCELERLKYKIYTQREPELPPLTDNKVFKPVKNMIIRAVLNMNMPEPSPYSVPQNDDSDDTAFSDIDNDVFTWNDEDAVEVEVESSNLHVQWSKDYKRACKLYYKKDATDDEKKEAVGLLHSEAEKGNVLAIHDLGKVYIDDKEKSDAYYKQALDGFLELEPMSMKLQPYLQYRIGKMYCYGSGIEQNYAESFGWFLKSAYAGNKFAQFSLANQYYYGNGFYKDKEQALHWYMKAAEQGLPYAAYAVAQMYANGEAVLQDEATAQQYYAQALAGFLKLEESDRADDNLLYKLGRMYRYVLGTDEDIPKALEYFSRSAKHGNINAKRMIAIEQLSGEQIPCDVNKAVETLKELAENGDAMSAYRLGKLYLFGEDGIERDVPQAIQWLTKSAEDGNEYAQELLDNMEQRENAAFASTIFGLFVSLSHAIENDYSKNHKKLHSKVDSKIQQMIRKHKQELGIKEEYGQQTQNY